MQRFFHGSLTAAFLVAVVSTATAQEVKKDIPYVEKGHARHVLDIYAPKDAKQAPVVFWIHGGGWQAGDKSLVQEKPKAFVDKGYVFVSTNYRLLPEVEMIDIFHDIAKSLAWTRNHILEYGGDPKQILVMGHSAGAQLAAIICTDHRLLQNEGLTMQFIKGCVPVDGDTFDVPAIIAVAETRWKVHELPPAKFGHRAKFGNDEAKHRDYSAVNHIEKGRYIPPFLIMYVQGHPDTTAQAQRLANVLKANEIPVTLYGGKETTHSKINDDIGVAGDPGTEALFKFCEEALKK